MKLVLVTQHCRDLQHAIKYFNSLKLLYNFLFSLDYFDADYGDVISARKREFLRQEPREHNEKVVSKFRIDKLEDQLMRSWKELDRMLFCTKLPMCVIR